MHKPTLRNQLHGLIRLTRWKEFIPFVVPLTIMGSLLAAQPHSVPLDWRLIVVTLAKMPRTMPATLTVLPGTQSPAVKLAQASVMLPAGLSQPSRSFCMRLAVSMCLPSARLHCCFHIFIRGGLYALKRGR